MNNELNRTRFITFEGIDGVGKSTQISMLYDYLAARKIECYKTREPGGTKEAEQIRELILENKFSPMTELLLFFAARAEHVNKVVLPKIQSGEVVLCDRYIDSTLVYQGFNGFAEDFIMNLHNMTVKLMPDLTFVLYADVSKLNQRINMRGEEMNKYDLLPAAQMEKMQEHFFSLSKKYSDRIILINADQDENEVHKVIIQNLYKKNEKI